MEYAGEEIAIRRIIINVIINIISERDGLRSDIIIHILTEGYCLPVPDYFDKFSTSHT